jgi:hypothetical protein
MSLGASDQLPQVRACSSSQDRTERASNNYSYQKRKNCTEGWHRKEKFSSSTQKKGTLWYIVLKQRKRGFEG